MKNIDPNKLKIGDVVITTDASPLAEIIRWKTWGRQSVFDLRKGTHAGMICDRGGGLFYVSEMLAGGLSMTELQTYDHGAGSWFPHWCRVGRHPLLDGEGKRENLNDYMIQMHSFGVKYGYEQLLKFMDSKIPDNPYTLICSQYIALAFQFIDIPLPDEWNGPDKNFDLCTPKQWQEWKGIVDINFKM